jgi:hypothetical protein
MLRSALLSALIACAGLGVAAEDGARPDRPGEGRPRAEAGRDNHDAQRDHLRGILTRHHLLMLAQFDADGDHRLSEAERTAAKTWFEERRAANQEKRAAGKEQREERRAAGQERREERRDERRDGDGEDPKDAQAAKLLGEGKEGDERRRHLHGVLLRTHVLMLARFDADQDGRISDAERETAKAWFEQQRAALKAAHEARKGGDDDGPGTSLSGEERAALGAFLPGAP